MREFFWKHDAGVKLTLFLVVLLLLANLVFLNRLLLANSDLKAEEGGMFEFVTSPAIDICGKRCQKYIEEKIAQAVATLSAAKKEIVVQKTASSDGVTYIPIGASGSTRNRDWTDVKSTEVFIDPADYGQQAAFTWEAFIKVDQGSGKAFARLFDATHSIGVVGSEISYNSAEYNQVISDSLNLWSGRNLYRVQIKSLNGGEVFFNTGRVRVKAK